MSRIPRYSAFSLPCGTRIVATVGPASRDPEVLQKMAEAGASVFRLNAAHGSEAEREQALALVRDVERRLRRPLAVLVDLAGPKVRLRPVPGGAVDLAAGQEVRLTGRRGSGGGPLELPISHPRLLAELRPDDRILLGDGEIELRVVSAGKDGALCRVCQGGQARSGQGVHLPGIGSALQALTPADRRVVEWAVRREVDYLGLSFAGSARDVERLRRWLRKGGSEARIVAKIERAAAVERLDEIVAAADAVMVARGDLGVELDPAEVPVLQKRIIARARRAQKPVITATQMLDSMREQPRPTRAEAADVANAVLDGTDACMLSGETAIGRYPVQAVRMLARIAARAEALLPQAMAAAESPAPAPGLRGVTQAMVRAAARVACETEADMVVVATRSGATAQAFSQLRVRTATVGWSPALAVARRMQLYWGMAALWPQGWEQAPLDDLTELRRVAQALRPARRRNMAVVLDASGSVRLGHNRLSVWPLGET